MRNSKYSPQLQQIEQHPLFQGLDKTVCERLFKENSFQYYEPGEIIVSSIDDPQLMLVLEGRVEWELNDQTALRDPFKMLPSGELIGIEFIADYLGLSKMPGVIRSIRIRAAEACLCVHISREIVSACWENPSSRDYVTRQMAARLQDLTAWIAEHANEAYQWGASEPFVRQVSDFMHSPAVEISTQAGISEAAHLMAECKVNSLIVMNGKGLAGILTSSDIVRNVGKNSGAGHDPKVFQWMTPDPVTIQPGRRYDEALALFLQYNINHLPVIENDRVVGMLTLSDLMRKQDRGVLQTLQQIEQTDSDQLPNIRPAIYDVLSGLIRDGIPIRHAAKIITDLYDRLFCRCIELGLQRMEALGFGPPPLPFCWLQMGSAGRSEQLMLTDQDHFIVYDDPYPETGREQIDRYFTALSEEVVMLLEQAGYEPCPGKMMANHTQWRGSVTQWRHRLKQWERQATSDDLMNAFNFFSFRYVHGDKKVYDRFLKMLYSFIEPNGMLMFRLAMIVKQNPVAGLDNPMKSLLRLKGTLELKKEILFPFQHSILILALYHDIYEGNPLQKVEQLVMKKAVRPALADEIVFAYDCLLRLRLERHWAALQSRRPELADLKLSQFNTREQNNLRQSIKIIRTLQNQMLSKFGLK